MTLRRSGCFHSAKCFLEPFLSIQKQSPTSRQRTKKLTGKLIVSQFTAEYRLRAGPYRVLYDVDDQRKKVVLLKLAKRNEQTYN